MKHISTLPAPAKLSINANLCHHYCDDFGGKQGRILGPEAMEEMRLRRVQQASLKGTEQR